MNRRPRLLPAATLIVALAAACTGATATTSPSQPPAASPSAQASASAPASAASAASGEAPSTPEEAAALVIAANQDFLGFEAKNPDMIGQCCWWEVTETSDGYRVLVHAGWGDCPAGCINEHEWAYSVTSTGEVALLEETGDPVPAGGIPQGM